MTSPVTTGGTRQPQTIGRYEIQAQIGVGGFATVLRAHDPLLDDLVAIKILDPGANGVAEIRDRFLQEARLLRRVDDPHVVTVHDIGELDDGRPYFVMEYAAGGALAGRMPTGPSLVDVASLTTVVRSLDAALSALHGAGVVHRDVKPANVLIVDPTSHDGPTSTTSVRLGVLENHERLILGDLGIAKDTERDTDQPTMLGGSPGFRAPEQGMLGGEITPATDVFGATGVLWNLLTGAQPPAPDQLQLELPALPPAWREVLARGLDPDPAKRYGTAASWAEAALAAIGDSSGTQTIGFRSAEPGSACPYKGLAAFQPDDAGLFFGRESLIDDLVARIQGAPALIIGGPSGSGKSSLLRAGLIPAINAGRVPGGQHWQVGLFSPGSDALGELAHHLGRLGDTDLTADDLRNEPRAGQRALSDDRPTLIAIDQFEELFTLTADPEDRATFIATLAALSADRHARHRVVLALRADFYDACAHHPWLADRINENQLLVGPMSRAELRRAVEGPASRVGMQLEAGLVDTILDDAGASTGSLPLVAHALMETWLRRRGHVLTLEGYLGAGGVAGAIAQTAESTWSQLAEPDRELARQLVLQLTRPGDNGPDTRRPVRWEALPDADGMYGVIETFAEARLLTVDQEQVDLAHETLLRTWPRAKDWIDDARDDLRTRQRITSAANEWRQAGHDADQLWRGARLETALQWAEGKAAALSPDAAAFLDAAQTARDEAAEAEAAELGRRRRTRRNAVVALSVLTLAAVVASVLAFVGLRDAREKERVAVEAEDTATTQFTRALAASADAQAGNDPMLAIALAIESAARSDPSLPEAREALVEARVALALQPDVPRPLIDPLPVGDAQVIAMSADADTLYVGDRSGLITVWDLGRLEVRRTLESHQRGIEALEVDRTGQYLASGDISGRLVLWDFDNSEPNVVDEIDEIIWDVEFSPDSTRLAAVAEDGRLYLYDVASGMPLGDPIVSRPNTDATAMAWTADGTQVLVGNGAGQLIVVTPPATVDDLEPALVEGPFQPHISDIWEITASPDGSFLYTVSADGQVKQWNGDPSAWTAAAVVESRPGLFAGTPDEGVSMEGLRVSPDGTELWVGGSDGRIRRWNIAEERIVGTSETGHGNGVKAGALAGDGSVYASLGDDQMVQLWSADAAQLPVGTATAVDGSPSAVAVTPDGSAVVIGTTSGLLHRLDRSGAIIWSTDAGVETTAVAIAGDRVVIGGRDGTLRSVALDDGRPLADAVAFDNAIPVLSMATVPGTMNVVVGGGAAEPASDRDGRIVLYDAEALVEVQDISGPGRPQDEVAALAVTPDGSTIVSGHLATDVGFWSLEGGRTSDRIQPGEDSVRSLAVSPDGEHLVVAGARDAAVLLRVDDGSVVARLTPLSEDSRARSNVAFSTGGETVIGLSGADATVLLWDTRTGARIGPALTVHGQEGAGTGLAVANERIWSTSIDGSVFRLDVLDIDQACEATDGVLDPVRADRYLGGETPVSCTEAG